MKKVLASLLIIQVLFCFPIVVSGTEKTSLINFAWENWNLAAIYENCSYEINSSQHRILRVPGEFPTIVLAVESAEDGDWIILSPGKYFEQEIEINKSISISSEWKITGNESIIEETVLDSQDKRLFIISSDNVEISGLKIVNGDHTLDVSARVTIIHNHFINNLDGISLESGSGGYIAFNSAENDRDDALDIDIGEDQNKTGSDVIIEYNRFLNCNDDGIEIRLFKYPEQNINYTIRHNQIIGSKNAGVQLISYDQYTGKKFNINHNIFKNCKTGLGCMEGSNTKEDLGGASKMDELVCFYNNTVIDCEMGATGGNQIIAVNNIIQANNRGGFKNFGPNSVISNNLFVKEVGESLIEVDSAVLIRENLYMEASPIDKINYMPIDGSPAIDAGISFYKNNGKELFRIQKSQITGDFPDLGAVEARIHEYQSDGLTSFWVDAGEDRVFGPHSSDVLLSAIIDNPFGISLESSWSLAEGPEKVIIQSPDLTDTRILFTIQGIYRFTISISDGKNLSSDNVIARYIEEGEGKQLFLKEDTENVIEMEEFSYAYGNVQTKEIAPKTNNRYIIIQDNSGEKGPGILEYFVGMAETNQYHVWILAKALSRSNNISFVFDNKSLGEIDIKKTRKFSWIKLPGSIIATPGQRTLLILGEEGEVLLDKMVFTENPDFNPNKKCDRKK